jgi:hypothetical protein
MSNDVQVGADGWLFLKGGTNNAEDYYTEQSAFSVDKLKKWQDLLEFRHRQLAGTGVRYLHFLAPDKTSVYPEFYGKPLPNFHSHPIRLFDTLLRGTSYWVNVLDDIVLAKETAPVFYKTDSHWNFHGCFAAYKCLCKTLGVVPNESLATRSRSRAEIVMDLGGKLSPRVAESAEFVHMLRDSKRGFANQLVAFNESEDARKHGSALYNSIVRFENYAPTAVPLKVLVFGDSFCEFRPHMLTGMLAETFRELTFIWNHSVDFNYVGRYTPDILITENVERFVNRVPVDGVDVIRAAQDRFAELVQTKKTSLPPP